MLRIFIGYDPSEAVAFHVLSHSLMRHASRPISITPINKRNIPEFTRGKEDGSTEFSFSRFLTPYLAGYQGYAIFMDCDMLVRSDIYEVMSYVDPWNDVSVVKHDYKPKSKTKFLGNIQYGYPMKNWSSFMVFNCNNWPVKLLTVDRVNTSTGKYLHRFEWTSTNRIGELPAEWNHLVGEYEAELPPKIVHFTLGTPCFKGCKEQDYAQEWFAEREMMLHAD